MNNPTAEQIATDFLKLLADNDQYLLLPQITEILQKEVYKNQDITVISAGAVTGQEKDSISKMVLKKWGEHQINWLIDPMLLSGLIIKFQNQIIDASGKNQLKSLAKALK